MFINRCVEQMEEPTETAVSYGNKLVEIGDGCVFDMLVIAVRMSNEP